MAEFKYKTVKHMQPRPGVKYATDYYKQSRTEYTRLDEHIRSVMEQVITAARDQGLIVDLELPLPGFPRTNRQPNYSALDIMTDMLDQFDHERDLPSGMLGRWNRLFEANPAFQIDLVEDSPPNPVFNQLFYR